MPVLPNVLETASPFRQTIQDALTLLNPRFNGYHITDTCPFLYDPLQEDPTKRLSTDPPPYFNHTDVQKVINAPFTVCVGTNFVTKDGGDNAPKSIFTTLPKVFDRTPRDLVVNGALDMLIPSDGTLFAL
jgi:carboxypeptidase D